MSIPTELLQNLNSAHGPDFKHIVHPDHAKRLPANWRMSFGRVSPTALTGDTRFYEQLGRDFQAFERACAQLVHEAPEWAQPFLGSGIDTTTQFATHYQAWRTPFSVRRLDVVLAEGYGPVVNENDEMPGGLVHAYWLDHCYQVNQRRWAQAINWLTAPGLLVFAVSSKWSAPYTAELRWFADHLRRFGYNVQLITERDMPRISRRGHDICLDSTPIRTVWRQFPVFEAHEAFGPLVLAAATGQIRMVPEFASWGNKAWFGAFWDVGSVISSLMGYEQYQRLGLVLPPSALFHPDNHDLFPVQLHQMRWEGNPDIYESFAALCAQQTKAIHGLVAKTAGAHSQAARSHGVVIGRSCSVRKWEVELRKLAQCGAPVVLQRYAKPAALELPMTSVLDDKTTYEPAFKNRTLVRPWYIGGELVSATAFVQEPSTKLHGKVSGCEVPLSFD